jgi:F-type H+-transporting ATPase subunit b
MLELLLLLALIVLGVIMYRVGAHRMLVGVLDDHAAKVKAELDEAKRLREEAQGMLAEQRRKLAGGEHQAQAIASQAKTESERMVERHRRELEASLSRRTEQALERIAQEEARALQEVRSRAATLAVRTTARLLGERLEGERGQALLDDAIVEIGRKLA